MKYFLKIDRGDFYEGNKPKYITIPLEKINPNLYHNNNFQTLCEYTMTFENENALKAELINKGLIPRDSIYLHIGIGYTYNKLNYFLPAPYMEHKSFFNFNTLCNFISKKIEENRQFAIQFLFLIKDEKGLNPENCYQLKKYGMGFYRLYKPDPWVRNVLKDIIIREGKVSYRTLYYVAMIAYKISSQSQTTRADEIQNVKADSLYDGASHRNAIEEETNNLDQMSLF